MENAVQALKTAAAVLIFVIAITASFTMFSKAKATADVITTMQDKQEYLEAAELDNGILYTSSKAIGEGSISGMTTNGDRIVKPDDVISTIYRYYLEKYGVTVIKSNGESNGEVIARFDSSTESFVQSWTNEMQGEDSNGNTLYANDLLTKYEDQIKNNISNTYVSSSKINLELEELYEIDNTNTKKFGAPWYGTESEIIKRINADIEGTNYTKDEQIYTGKNLKEKLKDEKIIEVVNEIDTSEYIKDGDNNTQLLKEYQLPTIEIVYIIGE